MSKRNKRKNFFIKKNLQGKLILGYFLFVIGGCLFFILLLGMLSADSLTINYTNHDLQMGKTPLVLVKEVITAHWIFLVTVGTILVIAAMFLTHRIAGPFYRFERTIDAMSSGILNEAIHLRKKDEGKDLANKINSFNTILSSKLRTIDQQSRAIEALYRQYHELADAQGNSDDVESILQSIKKHNDIIQEIGNSFTLIDE